MEREVLPLDGVQKEHIMEHCVLCGNMTDVRQDIDITCRACYVPGVGQLCEKCCMETYGTTDWQSKYG